MYREFSSLVAGACKVASTAARRRPPRRAWAPDRSPLTASLPMSDPRCRQGAGSTISNSSRASTMIRLWRPRDSAEARPCWTNLNYPAAETGCRVRLACIRAANKPVVAGPACHRQLDRGPNHHNAGTFYHSQINGACGTGGTTNDQVKLFHWHLYGGARVVQLSTVAWKDLI